MGLLSVYNLTSFLASHHLTSLQNKTKLEPISGELGTHHTRLVLVLIGYLTLLAVGEVGIVSKPDKLTKVRNNHKPRLGKYV